MTSRLASGTFKMASKVFIEETDKNVEFITEILQYGNTLVLFWNETSSGVLNFKYSLLLRAIIPTGHTFEGQCTARLRSLDTAIGGSSVTLKESK